jgi:hypothetical protein
VLLSAVATECSGVSRSSQVVVVDVTATLTDKPSLAAEFSVCCSLVLLILISSHHGFG